jgi:hypothetical protein
MYLSLRSFAGGAPLTDTCNPDLASPYNSTAASTTLYGCDGRSQAMQPI